MNIDMRLALIIAPVVGYVIGSTPFGMLIAKAKGVDLRKVGSGNVGATNVGRTLGKKWGYLCFILDVLKGMVCAVGAMAVTSREPAAMSQAIWLAAGCGAILGHVFSFWLRFKGGKGVATSLGVVVGIYPYFTFAGLVAFAIWIAVTLKSRYVSLGSIVAAAAFVPLFVAFNWPANELWPLGSFALAMVALIIIRHRSNIGRLMAGTENKIGKSKST